MSELNEEFTGQVNAQNVDATTPDSMEHVQQLGFQNHGLVVQSPAQEVLFKQPDHEVVMLDVRTKLEELTASR